MVLISGAPGMGERSHSPLLHHKVKDFSTQRETFEKITLAPAAIEDPASAPRKIDAALEACIEQKRPVYIELPRDIVGQVCEAPARLRAAALESDAEVLEESLEEAAGMLRAAKRPVILAGVEIHRFGLQDRLLALVEKTGYPVAATLLGKSIVVENHAQYLGIYEGAMGRHDVCRRVEGAEWVWGSQTEEVISRSVSVRRPRRRTREA